MATRSKKAGTALAVYDEEFAAAARKQAAAVKTFGSFKNITFRAGVMSIDDNPVKNNALRCIILANVRTNMYYEGKFDPNNPSGPTCYAYGDPEADDPEEGMAPHEKSAEPQADTCADCPHNQMGSADTGRGKRCQNVQRIAVITEDALESAEALTETEVRSAKIPVTSVKNFSKYVHQLADDMQRPTWGVITQMSVAADPKTQFKVLFAFEELIKVSRDVFEALKAKIADVTKELLLPQPDLATDVAASGNGHARSPSGKRATQAATAQRQRLREEPAKPAARKALRPATTGRRG